MKFQQRKKPTATNKTKYPSPEDPALVSPHKGVLEPQRNSGMVEKWNIGNQKRMMV
jgi:hypothetical protein